MFQARALSVFVQISFVFPEEDRQCYFLLSIHTRWHDSWLPAVSFMVMLEGYGVNEPVTRLISVPSL